LQLVAEQLAGLIAVAVTDAAGIAVMNHYSAQYFHSPY